MLANHRGCSMLSTAEELKQKTLAYWKLSQIWNGKREVELPTEDAMKICAKIIDQTSATRPLYHCMNKVLEEIIAGTGKKVESKILEFKRKEG